MRLEFGTPEKRVEVPLDLRPDLRSLLRRLLEAASIITCQDTTEDTTTIRFTQHMGCEVFFALPRSDTPFKRVL